MRMILIYIITFLLGFFSCMLLNFTYKDNEMPLKIGALSLVQPLKSPGNWIKEGQIHIYENAIVIDIENASLSRYSDTGSMKPILDENSNGIKIIPENPDQINVGDIVTFEKNGLLIIHRVIEKGRDEEGAFFITKGDNNSITDGKIRFKDIKYVTIGVLW